MYSVPHTGNLPFPMSDGKEITIDGVVSPYGNRFSVNLCSGPTYDSDTALHFNPRFDQNEVVRTHRAGDWGNEEKHGGFPFYKGSPYQIKISAQPSGYHVYVNNSMFCEFRHRLPKEMVRFLYIEGDTTVNNISYLDTMNPPLYNPPVPLAHPIPGGLYPGRVIIVDGLPNFGGSRFNVNFVCGPSLDCDDVAMNFDARFNYGNSRHIVVRNHKQYGNWGQEDNYQNFFPFVENTMFEIRIVVESYGFKVSVNGQHFIDFNHRLQPFQRANFLVIEGDVRITQVRFQ